LKRSAIALAALFLLVACGPAATTARAPSAPRGFTSHADRELGFEIEIAPGWKESARDPNGGVDYAGPGAAEMVVHFEQASSTRLDLAAIPVLAELSGGGGLADIHQSPGRLGGRHAQRTDGRFSVGGQARAMVAYVMVEGPRVWALALVGAPATVAAARSTWEKMVSTFRLTGAHPTPPARATVGLPAPGFPALDRIKGPVVVNFFATWCVDCRTDVPTIARAAAAHRGRLTLVGVDCCNDDPSSVPAFLRELGVQGQFRTVVYDNGGNIARSYSLLGPPTTIVLDRDHVLRQMVAGPVTRSSLEQGLRSAGVT
jgi:cytochrome c biogenesis protein CcmG/thiol:disulfide interchange protein DsbE